ncbi:MAG: glycosidase [Sphingomonadales bacterium]|nr:MAG: glycosidase [Sphingomonadales bacterium]
MLATLKHSKVTLRPDPARTVIRPFAPGDPAGFENAKDPRGKRIVARVRALEPADAQRRLAAVLDDLATRHRDVETMLMRRFEEVRETAVGTDTLSRECALLIGAYFCEEYSFEAAALFNPSMVLHPDQSGLPERTVRVAMSLRGIGEGHVSSVTFRTGTWALDGEIAIDPLSSHAVAPQIEPVDGEEGSFWLICDDSRQLSETVLFPVAPSQKQGIEDVRLVNFTEEDGSIVHLGTYTAFSGSTTRSELLQAASFNKFLMRPMRGVIEKSKGTALFPRRVNGRYMMLGRQDNENIWLLSSDSLTDWQDAAKLVTPRYPWEFVQMGNCGSPIEIDEGWLVMTHGVGMVRNYCIGACLLDKADPSKVLARTPEPLLQPGPEERDGYVPNVVYSCGGIVHDRTLLLPYGVADGFTAFASMPVDELLGLMR